MERKVNITYYGMLEEAVGIREESMAFSNVPVNLRETLIQRHPTLQNFTFSIAVDMEYREELNAEETPKKIDLMPPFSGG